MSPARGKSPRVSGKSKRISSRWWIAGGALLAVVIGLVAWLLLSSSTPALAEAPEAGKVMEVQATMPFQIIIPAYMPADFERGKVDIKVSETGPSGEPMAQLAYRTRQGATLNLKQWVPVNPDMETLSGSRPIQTKWGKGWLLTQVNLVALWVDVGPLRISLYTTNLDVLSREDILQMADTLGPPTNNQVFTFSVEKPVIKDVPPPPPVEAKVGADGVQELVLVITPGGYSPLRISFKQGVPARLVFRQLGQVGCGNVLIFPADPQSPTALTLKSESDQQVLEWTPQVTGQFLFRCSHDMYRGILFIRE